jgi:transposase
MLEIDKIRTYYFNNGKSVSEICKDTKHDRKTVDKYLNIVDWSEPLFIPELVRGSILDPYKSEIDIWLESDRKVRRKQRHTAKRIYNRLKENHPDFDISYRTVAHYVSIKKSELYGSIECYLPLEHKAGEAQVDFGKAEFIECGKRVYGSYLIVSFPYSNAGYVQLYKGENFECFVHGLRTIYEHIGGVPYRQWFDNLSSAVKVIGRGKERVFTDGFIRFKEHYRFEATFCNPASGNEKGNVENKVGYIRRNFLVPIPEFSDIDAYNIELLSRCDLDLFREHYRKGVLIKELFSEDICALNPLPEKVFDAESYERVRVDSCGRFTLDDGKHIYSSSPLLACKSAIVVKTHDSIIVLDKDMRPLVSHKRLYGSERQESMNWIMYLSLLSKKPAALKYTGIYNLLPDTVQNWLDAMPTSKKSSGLKLLADMSNDTDFSMAVSTLERALSCGVTDLESISAVYRLMSSECPVLGSVCLPNDTPLLQKVDSDVSKYDSLFAQYCNNGGE